MIFLDLLRHWANTDHVAAVDPEGRPLSFKELDRRSDALAARLIRDLPGKAPVLIRGTRKTNCSAA